MTRKRSNPQGANDAINRKPTDPMSERTDASDDSLLPVGGDESLPVRRAPLPFRPTRQATSVALQTQDTDTANDVLTPDSKIQFPDTTYDFSVEEVEAKPTDLLFPDTVINRRIIDKQLSPNQAQRELDTDALFASLRPPRLTNAPLDTEDEDATLLPPPPPLAPLVAPEPPSLPPPSPPATPVMLANITPTPPSLRALTPAEGTPSSEQPLLPYIPPLQGNGNQRLAKIELALTNKQVISQYQSRKKKSPLHLSFTGSIARTPSHSGNDGTQEEDKFVCPKFIQEQLVSLSVPIGLAEDNNKKLCESHLTLRQAKDGSPMWMRSLVDLMASPNKTIQFRQQTPAAPYELDAINPEQRLQLCYLLTPLHSPISYDPLFLLCQTKHIAEKHRKLLRLGAKGLGTKWVLDARELNLRPREDQKLALEPHEGELQFQLKDNTFLFFTLDPLPESYDPASGLFVDDRGTLASRSSQGTEKGNVDEIDLEWIRQHPLHTYLIALLFPNALDPHIAEAIKEPPEPTPPLSSPSMTIAFGTPTEDDPFLDSLATSAGLPTLPPTPPTPTPTPIAFLQDIEVLQDLEELDFLEPEVEGLDVEILQGVDESDGIEEIEEVTTGEDSEELELEVLQGIEFLEDVEEVTSDQQPRSTPHHFFDQPLDDDDEATIPPPTRQPTSPRETAQFHPSSSYLDAVVGPTSPDSSPDLPTNPKATPARPPHLASTPIASNPPARPPHLARPSEPTGLARPSPAPSSQPIRPQPSQSQPSLPQASHSQASLAQLPRSQPSQSQASLPLPSRSQASLAQLSQSQASLAQLSHSQPSLAQLSTPRQAPQSPSSHSLQSPPQATQPPSQRFVEPAPTYITPSPARRPEALPQTLTYPASYRPSPPPLPPPLSTPLDMGEPRRPPPTASYQSSPSSAYHLQMESPYPDPNMGDPDLEPPPSPAPPTIVVPTRHAIPQTPPPAPPTPEPPTMITPAAPPRTPPRHGPAALPPLPPMRDEKTIPSISMHDYASMLDAPQPPPQPHSNRLGPDDTFDQRAGRLGPDDTFDQRPGRLGPDDTFDQRSSNRLGPDDTFDQRRPTNRPTPSMVSANRPPPEETAMRRIEFEPTPLNPDTLGLHIQVSAGLVGLAAQQAEYTLSTHGSNRSAKFPELGLAVHFSYSETDRGKVFPRVVIQRSANIRGVTFADNPMEIFANRNENAHKGFNHIQDLPRGHMAKIDLSAQDQARGILLLTIQQINSIALVGSLRMSWYIDDI